MVTPQLAIILLVTANPQDNVYESMSLCFAATRKTQHTAVQKAIQLHEVYETSENAMPKIRITWLPVVFYVYACILRSIDSIIY